MLLKRLHKLKQKPSKVTWSWIRWTAPDQTMDVFLTVLMWWWATSPAVPLVSPWPSTAANTPVSHACCFKQVHYGNRQPFSTVKNSTMTEKLCILMQTMFFLKTTESWKADFIKKERKKLLNYKTQLVKSLQPKIYCPFAGYFTEAHPSDRWTHISW